MIGRTGIHSCISNGSPEHAKHPTSSITNLPIAGNEKPKRRTQNICSKQLRHAGFADPPTHQEQQRKAPFCMVVDAAKQQPVLSILQPACAQLLFCQLQLYVLAASSFNDTSCAKLTPPVTLSHDWKAASHFLQRFVPDIYLGVIMTFTFLSAKCQPHQVSQAAGLTFQDALRMR